MTNKILDILSSLRPEFDFSASSNFIEDGFLDSFDVVSLVTELEENFNISIDGDEITPDNFSSVDSILRLVERSNPI